MFYRGRKTSYYITSDFFLYLKYIIYILCILSNSIPEDHMQREQEYQEQLFCSRILYFFKDSMDKRNIFIAINLSTAKVHERNLFQVGGFRQRAIKQKVRDSNCFLAFDVFWGSDSAESSKK